MRTHYPSKQEKIVHYFEKYKKLLHHECWLFCRSTRMDYNDLFGEAQIVFLNCLEKHDSDKSRFSTFLVRSIRNHFLSLFEKYRKEKEMLIPWDSVPHFPPIAPVYPTEELQMNNLSAPAKLIVQEAKEISRNGCTLTQAHRRIKSVVVARYKERGYQKAKREVQNWINQF